MPDGSPLSPVTVRVANRNDVHSIMDLAVLCADESAFLDADPRRLLEAIWPALHLDHGMVGVIDGDEPGRLQGSILLRVGPPWFGTQPFLEERSIFVHPEFRGGHGGPKGGRAKVLVDFAKFVARRMQMKLLVGILSTERTAAKVRLYERMFGKPSGAFWLFDPSAEEASGGETRD